MFAASNDDLQLQNGAVFDDLVLLRYNQIELNRAEVSKEHRSKLKSNLNNSAKESRAASSLFSSSRPVKTLRILEDDNQEAIRRKSTSHVTIAPEDSEIDSVQIPRPIVPLDLYQDPI